MSDVLEDRLREAFDLLSGLATEALESSPYFPDGHGQARLEVDSRGNATLHVYAESKYNSSETYVQASVSLTSAEARVRDQIEIWRESRKEPR